MSGSWATVFPEGLYDYSVQDTVMQLQDTCWAIYDWLVYTVKFRVSLQVYTAVSLTTVAYENIRADAVD